MTGGHWTGARQPKTRGGDGSSAGAAPSRRGTRRLIIAAVVIALAVVGGCLARSPWSPFKQRGWPPNGWLIAACDVGQGDGLAIADGPATAVVVDTGPDPDKMDRCLRGLGIERIPIIILTHFHADHIDGLPGVLRGRHVEEIETTIVDDPPEGAAKVRELASAAGIPISKAFAGEQRTYGSLSWEVLWPDPSSPVLQAAQARDGPSTTSGTRPSRSSHTSRSSGSSGSPRSSRRGHGSSRHGEEGSGPNNSSIVIHVRAETPDGPVTMLLTGDVEPPAQQAILADHPDLASDVFKVPHHGSAYQEPGFVAAVRPRVSLISVGAGNSYGHPAARTMALAASTGATVFRTDRDGEIVVFGSARNLRAALHG